jgi:hypothetical protein
MAAEEHVEMGFGTAHELSPKTMLSCTREVEELNDRMSIVRNQHLLLQRPHIREHLLKRSSAPKTPSQGYDLHVAKAEYPNKSLTSSWSP